MSLIEIDQVAIPVDDWVGVLKGDKEAIERVKALCDGLVLYMHALSCGEECVFVTLRDLENYNILFEVTLAREK